jgi:glycosyltransferase involved in cell wall biosynthesis
MRIGGAERVVQHLMRGLDPTRFDVELCCTKSGGALADELRAEGHRVIDLDARTRIAKHGIPWTLRRLIARRGYDVVHTHDSSTFIDALQVRLLASSARFVHTFHFGNYPHIPSTQLALERLAARAPHHLIAVSDAQRRAVIEHLRVGAHRIRTVYNGVEHNRYAHDPGVRQAVRDELGLSRDDVAVGCVATMTRQKGIPYLLEAIAAARPDVPRAVFMVVGGGPMLEEMRQLAASVGLGQAVRFLGWRDDATRLMVGLDLLVSSSLWEGFAMVLLEGMAAGRAILATDVGDNRQAVTDGVGGAIVPPGDSAALASALVALVRDPRRLEEMGRAGYERYVGAFTVKHMVGHYARLYESQVGDLRAVAALDAADDSVISANGV